VELNRFIVSLFALTTHLNTFGTHAVTCLLLITLKYLANMTFHTIFACFLDFCHHKKTAKGNISLETNICIQIYCIICSVVNT